MVRPYNLFISWSGTRSHHVASYLREWLPTVLQSTNPWMSDTDIEKGSRGLDEIKGALNGIKVGISCLTPENLSNPWILYEAGALTKTVDDRTRLCTYLLAGLTPQQIPPPLGMFQHTQAEREDTRKLVLTINNVIGESPVSGSKLDNLFDKLWPDLEHKLHTLPALGQQAPPARHMEDMVAEILDLERVAANRRKEADWLDQYMPMLQKLFPLLQQALETAQSGVFTLVYHDRPKFGPGTIQQCLEKFHTLRDAVRCACNLMEVPNFHDPFILVNSELLLDPNQLKQEYMELKAEIHEECRKRNIDVSQPDNAFIVATFAAGYLSLQPFPDRERAFAHLADLNKSGRTDTYVVSAVP